MIPYKQPTVQAPYRVAIIGDTATEDDFQMKQPFTGRKYHVFKSILNSLNVNTEACMMGYLFGEVAYSLPPSDGFVMMEQRNKLRKAIDEFKPNIILLLGNQVLNFFEPQNKLKITEMRGTIFKPIDEDSPGFGYKCVACLDPKDLMKQASYIPLTRLDVSRALEEGKTAEFNPPNPVMDVHLTTDEIVTRLEAIKDGDTFAMDIEGYVDNITCLSIATSPEYAFAIDLINATLNEECRLIRALSKVLGNTKIFKILQHSLYDNFVLAFRYKMPIRGVVWDTMLSHWEIYPELPKNLGMQTSIWTKHPAHKHERKIQDWTTHLRYCCKDSIVTFDAALAQRDYLRNNPDSYKHFNFNMQLLSIVLYMQLKGICYDKAGANKVSVNVHAALEKIQSYIDLVAGKPININSPKQLCDLFYNTTAQGGLGLPVQHPKKGRAYDRSKRTSNVDAILKLQKTEDHPILTQVLTFRGLEKIRTMSEVATDEDNRIRCSYNLVGTDTGRMSCSKSTTGSGANLQTVTKKLRGLYKADPNHYFFQADLEGADGWTVAARCHELGDPTMLQDYYMGIKPARVIALNYSVGKESYQWSREKILAEGAAIGKGDTEWLYFVCKQVQHGTNYGLGAITMSANILKSSHKYLGYPVNVTTAQCKQLQAIYKQRYYGLSSWHTWVKQQLYNYRQLECASGHVRRFMGNPNNNSVFQSALSHEPQANTTYVTNLAFLKLGTNPENRDGDNYIVQPLHQVHDAVCGQFPRHQVAKAKRLIQEAFNNEIVIGNTKLKIPYDGGYGLDWKSADDKNQIGTL